MHAGYPAEGQESIANKIRKGGKKDSGPRLYIGQANGNKKASRVEDIRERRWSA